jgi:hypothetical protein
VKQLDRWLRREKKRATRVVYLEDALLTDRFWPYALFRLRYFFARYAVLSVAYAVKLLLLFNIFSNDFFSLLRAQALAGIAAAAWWGALEAMRGTVRDLHRSGQTHVVPREIGRWLSLAAQLSMVTLAIAVLWAVLRVLGPDRFRASDLYVVAILVRLASGFVVRSYHSGIYALQRVYRPITSMVGIDLASIGATLVLFPFVGAWSFPIATLVATAASMIVSLVFTRRTYRFFGFAPEQFVDVRMRPRFGRQTRELVLGGLSYGFMRLDAFLVLTLFWSETRVFNEAILFVLFFALGPTIRAGFEWAQLFYFDLKKLEIQLFSNLKQRFERHLFRLAILLGFIFWLIAAVAGTLIFQRGLGGVYVATLPFFLARSLLAVVQIRAYAEGAYWELLASGIACIVGFVAVGQAVQPGTDRIAWVAGVIFACFLLLLLIQQRRLRRPRPRDLRWIAEWLSEVGEVSEPLVIHGVRFWSGPENRHERGRPWHEENRWRYRDLAGSVARLLGPRGAVALVEPDRIVWFERVAADGAPALDRTWMLARGGGHVLAVESTGIQSDGFAALSVAAERGLLGDLGGDGDPVPETLLRKMFLQRFPRGMVYRIDDPGENGLRALTSEDKRTIIADAMTFARDFGRSRGRPSFDVTAYCEEGRLRMVFVAPITAPRVARERWRTFVRSANVRAAFRVRGAPSATTTPAFD